MLVSLIKKDKIYNLKLPKIISGSYWITDENNHIVRQLVNIDEQNGQWYINSNEDVVVFNNENSIKSTKLEAFVLYAIKIRGEEATSYVFATPIYDENLIYLDGQKADSFTFGSSDECDLIYKYLGIAPNHFGITTQNGSWVIKNLTNQYKMYVNNENIYSKVLKHGDSITLFGIRINVIGKLLIINCSKNEFSYNKGKFTNREFDDVCATTTEEDILNEEEATSTTTEDYFLRSPRVWAAVKTANIKIVNPPEPVRPDSRPFIYTIGPMLTMGLTSAITAYTTINNITRNGQSFSQALPSLLITFSMLLTTILWPLLMKRYEKKQATKREKYRVESYTAYLEKKKEEIGDIVKKQKQSLLENNVSLEECENIVLKQKTSLWERGKEHSDFLNICIGTADLPPLIEIDAPFEEFSLESDILKNKMNDIVQSFKIMEDVPINISLTQKYILGVVGTTALSAPFMDGLLLRLLTFHSYEDVKIVVLTSKENEAKWQYLKASPHIWSQDKDIRFFATNADEMKQVSSYLEKEFYVRTYQEDYDRASSKDMDYNGFEPYYVIITDNFKMARNIGIVKDVLSQKINKGFSIIIGSEKVFALPNECMSFISIDKTESGIFENGLVSNEGKKFVADINEKLNLQKVCSIMANIPIEHDNKLYDLPTVLGFLEMYNAGKIEQLNILNRWRVSNAISSLQAPIGMDQTGEILKLDLHEKLHGPHGLIAGMTGSGKSEFIITYILSMAINYNPYEVSFILIDYKGGGLAGAFENKITNIKLPHLAGSITNLDTVELKRSLASIESELKRRQRLFNEAREDLNESTIDIYKYQKLFRDGLVKKPVSHLFIICDEFAELKVQQPEFMDELISTARIGRSLGVHLILATQKPAGVVNDQIWSNSKFRVCLKVQEKSDSMDMIKRPDAASLKETGRFYLQVGYNEFFTMGQSAWCGKPYIPVDKIKSRVDTSINFIDNIGSKLKIVEENRKNDTTVSMGEELTNIVKYLSDIADKENIKIDQLWLDRIPDVIYVDELIKKYNYSSQSLILNPVIGEYDDPSNQQQGLLTLPLTEQGNALLFGMADSGKEIFLNSLIYSTIINHGPEEVNFYLLDFGAETLRIFSKSPQVGDVILANEGEKTKNLFKLLLDTLNARKKLFAEYNGSYDFYCKKSGNIIPQIVVVINNYEAFKELYDDYNDILSSLTREGTKCGILFVITAVSYNSVGFRLRQNIKQNLTLQLNDKSDYSTLLGNTNGTLPSNILGRGLVRIDKVLEFQSAYICDDEKTSDFIKDLCVSLKEKYKTSAKKIPVLPEVVSLNMFSDEINSLGSLPIGIAKETLKITTVDFKTNFGNLIVTSDEKKFTPFVPTFLKELSLLKNVSKIIFDAKNLFIDSPFGLSHYGSVKSNEALEKLENIISLYSGNTKYMDLVIVIIGLSEFKQQLNLFNQKNLIKLIDDAKATHKINLILIDTIPQIKNVEYDDLFKKNFANNRCIWLGSGITEQYTIKTKSIGRGFNADITNNFGYNVVDGNLELVKLIETDQGGE